MRSLNRVLAVTACAVTTLSAVGVAPAHAAPQLVVNGTFTGGTAPWWKSANTSMAVDAGRLRVNVTGGTANPWDAVIGQNGIALAKGTAYTLSFDASASAQVSAVTTVQLADSPYTRTLTKTISLGTTSKRFSFPFTAGLGTSAGQVSFQLGKNAGFTFHVDNVSLTETTPSPTPTVTTSPKPGSGPLAMTSGFYVDPDSNPAIWVRNNSGDARAARIKSSISAKPMARWFGGWSGDVRAAVSTYVAAANSADKLPVLVAYNIPGRDACGGHSGGGAGSESAYKTWISAFAAGIGNRPAVVIIEPDSLGDFGCMNDTAIQERNRMLTYATQQFRDKAPNTWAYLDAGNAGWVAAGTMAARLKNAGVGNIRGFAVNVSNYYPTAQSATYASSVNSSLGGGAKWVIDTSRNGNGSNGEWCNPAGRKLGVPTQQGGGGGTEMLLWVKVPGDSDGNCGIAPNTPAGQFSPAIAIRLIDGT
ncbi:glycoside hydrolase family 6 protein [Nonomuraea sp. 10N515B]|uniref:glycoside hydrolase family 6 protein n=1 Tax=Nonomuraea sp. 10N515B TaxID=3457422 RepID=UPI003FCC69CD